MPSIRVSGLHKSFDRSRKALDGVSIDIRSGEMVALIGASGSGKSTLLRHVSGLLLADRRAGSGVIEFDGRIVQRDGVAARDVRGVRAQIGFVFQQFNLVGRLPVVTNVLTGRLHRMPLWRSMAQHFRADEIERGMDALRRVGIADHAWKRASALSGGQQQRAAIARALVQQARVILADEPIASLDPESARRVMQILAAINREDGCTVVVSLHQVEIARRYCPRTVALHEGRVVYDGASAELTADRLREIYGAGADELVAAPDCDAEPRSSLPRFPAHQPPAARRLAAAPLAIS